MSRLVKGISSVAIFLATLLSGLAPSPPARAGDLPGALGVVQTVCQPIPDVCGPYDDIALVGAACLVSTDEIGCTLAIMKLGGSTVPADIAKAEAYRNVVKECIKQGLPIQGNCKALLDALELPVDKVNEVHGIVQTCNDIKDVDGALMCADYFLDTSIADDMGVKPPSYLGMLFDIYVDVRDKDYWSLVLHVGATAACAAANFILGVDVCNLLGVLADLGGALLDGLEAVDEVLDEIFGSSGCNYKKNGVCADPAVDISFWLHKYAYKKTMDRRLEGGSGWANVRPEAFALVAANEPLYQDIRGYEEKGWVRYVATVLYPLWDSGMKTASVNRKIAIEQHVKGLSASEFEVLFEKSQGDAQARIAKLKEACLAKVANETRQLQDWVAEGRGTAADVGGKPDTPCAVRIALRVVKASPLNPCTAQDSIERVNAQCNTAKALEVCKAAQGALGKEHVQCDFGKGGETGTAQATLQQFAMELKAQKVMCSYPILKGILNELQCEDPTYTERCKTRMVEKYGKQLGWPKPGIAECKLVLTEKRLKAMTDANKVATAAPGAIIPPPKPGTPTLKSFTCAVDKFDAAVVNCGMVPDAAQVAKVKAALPGVAIRLCTPDESGTYESKNWINEACISIKASGAITQRLDPIKVEKPPLTMPADVKATGKGVVAPGGLGGSGPAKNPVKPSGGLGGATFDKKPAGPPAVPSNLKQPGK